MSFKEITVAKVNDLKNGEMKNVSIGDGNEILLCKIDDSFFATAAHCTHYGAPLADGILSGDRIVCPWHHACFNAKTGNLEEPPARDSLTNYEVKIDGENVIVKVPGKLEGSKIPAMIKYNQENKNTFVVLGGGAAGNAAVQSLRENGYDGKLVMISQENRVPYDRPNLSKDYLQGTMDGEWMPLRSEDFYKDHNIELKLNHKVTNVDADRKSISFENGESLSYDKLLVATGGVSRKLNLPGSDLKNIFYLRSYDDCDKIIEAAQNSSKGVIIGASFIGMESAFSLSERKIKITVIGIESVPFENVFGKEIGNLFKKHHEEHGVEFRLQAKIKKFEGDGKVNAVVLENDEKIEADFVVVGIGVSPATGFLKGINLQQDGSIKVDERFYADKDIFVAGDVALFPDPVSGEHIRIEHWRTAEQQGRIAGANMTGKKIPFASAPFFWTVQAGLTLNYVGHAKSWDDIIIKGDVTKEDFTAYYIKDKNLVAAAGVNRDKELDIIEELFRLKKIPTEDEVKHESFIQNSGFVYS
jgi:apoptosis-inducing factor 3